MRYAPIPATLFADRRKGFAKKMLDASVAIFCSSDPMPRSGDTHYPFRQDSDVFRFSGLDQEGTILVLCPDAKKQTHREIAFILPEDKEHAIWHGERMSVAEARRISGIRSVYSMDQWDKVMPSLLRSGKHIYINPRHQEDHPSFPLSANDRMAVRLKKEYPDHRFIEARDILVSLAMVKHKHEIELLKSAVAVTGKAFERVLHCIQPGMKEFEVEAELTYVLGQHGCPHAFEPIIAAGPSACTLHYIRNDRVIGKDDLVLIDFGAEYACMAADMTRTIPASGRFTKRQRAVYTSVLNVLHEITDIMRPGITIPQLNQEAGKLIERELVHLKLISMRDLKKQDPKSPLYRKYFMHGIGHHLGYDVHDLSDRKSALKPGMVITCEPGLYIREEGIGIRLENDILITRSAPKNLMKHVPIEPGHIEEIMSTRPLNPQKGTSSRHRSADRD
jgi:Xaa-Pro aminopeptidase